MAERTDRDMLIEIHTAMGFVKKGLQDGADRLSALEKRLRTVEERTAKIVAGAVVIAALVSSAVFLIAEMVK